MGLTRRLQGVVIDQAGSLLDWGCTAPMEAFRVVYADEGVPITEAEARAPMGVHKRIHIYKISQMEPVRERWRAVHGADPTEKDIDRMFDKYQPMQLAILPKYKDLIPGALEALAALRDQGLKIGSTTGYTKEQTELLLQLMEEQGLILDTADCATGAYWVRRDGKYEGNEIRGLGKDMSRDKPGMCNLNALLMDVNDNALVLKAGDTPGDIKEGLHAGMLTVGFAMTGNEIGLSKKLFEALSRRDREATLRAAYATLKHAGAHYVIDGIWDLPNIVEDINTLLAQGARL